MLQKHEIVIALLQSCNKSINYRIIDDSFLVTNSLKVTNI